MKQKRQKFTKEFKEEAVSHWESSTNSAEEVAVSLEFPILNTLVVGSVSLLVKESMRFQAMVNFLAKMQKLLSFGNN